jgi:hypothetical protein
MDGFRYLEKGESVRWIAAKDVNGRSIAKTVQRIGKGAAAETLMATFERMRRMIPQTEKDHTLQDYAHFITEFKKHTFPVVQDGYQVPCKEFDVLMGKSTEDTQRKLEIFKEQHRDVAGHSPAMVLLAVFLSTLAAISPEIMQGDDQDEVLRTMLRDRMSKLHGVESMSLLFDEQTPNGTKFKGGRRITLKISHEGALPSQQAMVDTNKEDLFVAQRKDNLYIVSPSATPMEVTACTQLVMSWWREQGVRSADDYKNEGCFGTAYYTEQGAKKESKGMEFSHISSDKAPTTEAKAAKWFKKLADLIEAKRVLCLHGVITK